MKNSDKILVVLAFLFLSLSLLAIVTIPRLQVSSLQQQINILKNSKNLVIDSKDIAILEKSRIDAENAARTVIVQGAGGLFVAFTIVISFLNYQQTRRNVTLAEERQITENFNKAIEHLGSKEIYVRIGGIYTLKKIATEKIAINSEKDYWQIMEVLTAYVRDKSIENENALYVSTDTQAVVTVIRELIKAYGQSEKNYLNLRGSKLSKVILNNADFCGADLCRADLSGSDLSGANLKNANLTGANLENADLSGADLKNANLSGANLCAANLNEADLYGADLHQADLGTGIPIVPVDCNKLMVEPIQINRINLKNTDLRFVKNLTLKQIKQIKNGDNWELGRYDLDVYAQLGLQPKT